MGCSALDHEERPVGEIVSQLIDEGKAYAEAEVELAKARAFHKANGYKRAAMWGGAAFLFIIAAFVALGLTLVLVLASLIGPLLGGLAAILILIGIAGLFGLAAKNALPGSDEQ